MTSNPELPIKESELEEETDNEQDFNENDNDWEDWNDDDQNAFNVQCLICPLIHESAKESLSHMKQNHDFDFNNIRQTANLDLYQTVRFVNYIRKEISQGFNEKFNANFVLTGSEPFLNNDSYLKPIIEDDVFLTSLDDLEEWDNLEEANIKKKIFSHLPAHFQSGSSDEQIFKLASYAVSLQENLEEMAKGFKEFQLKVQQEFLLNVGTNMLSIDDQSHIPKKLVDNDTHYFDSYAYSDIHEIMLKDTVRTEAYRDFIYSNKDIFKDRIVLDVGCGTGILSMFAARAGAKKVYAVDNSAVIEKARQNVKDNNLEGIIELIQGKIENIHLPTKVDIIVSEWMGYFLLYEAMLDSVLHARDRFLNEDGIMAPAQTQILLSAYRDEKLVFERVSFWNDVYGFKMTSMRDELYHEAIVEDLDKEGIVAMPVVINDLDLGKITSKQLNFVSDFKMIVKSDGPIHGFIGWFDTLFNRTGKPNLKVDGHLGHNFSNEENGITFFTTGPHDTQTHWKQTLFLLREPLEAKKGTIIDGVFHCIKNVENERELDIEIHFGIDGSEKRIDMFRLR